MYFVSLKKLFSSSQPGGGKIVNKLNEKEHIKWRKKFLILMKRQEEQFADKRLKWKNKHLTLVNELEETKKCSQKAHNALDAQLNILEEKLSIFSPVDQEVERRLFNVEVKHDRLENFVCMEIILINMYVNNHLS